MVDDVLHRYKAVHVEILQIPQRKDNVRGEHIGPGVQLLLEVPLVPSAVDEGDVANEAVYLHPARRCHVRAGFFCGSAAHQLLCGILSLPVKIDVVLVVGDPRAFGDDGGLHLDMHRRGVLARAQQRDDGADNQRKHGVLHHAQDGHEEDENEGVPVEREGPANRGKVDHPHSHVEEHRAHDAERQIGKEGEEGQVDNHREHRVEHRRRPGLGATAAVQRRPRQRARGRQPSKHPGNDIRHPHSKYLLSVVESHARARLCRGCRDQRLQNRNEGAHQRGLANIKQTSTAAVKHGLPAASAVDNHRRLQVGKLALEGEEMARQQRPVGKIANEDAAPDEDEIRGDFGILWRDEVEEGPGRQEDDEGGRVCVVHVRERLGQVLVDGVLGLDALQAKHGIDLREDHDRRHAEGESVHHRGGKELHVGVPVHQEDEEAEEPSPNRDDGKHRRAIHDRHLRENASHRASRALDGVFGSAQESAEKPTPQGSDHTGDGRGLRSDGERHGQGQSHKTEGEPRFPILSDLIGQKQGEISWRFEQVPAEFVGYRTMASKTGTKVFLQKLR